MSDRIVTSFKGVTQLDDESKVYEYGLSISEDNIVSDYDYQNAGGGNASVRSTLKEDLMNIHESISETDFDLNNQNDRLSALEGWKQSQNGVTAGAVNDNVFGSSGLVFGIQNTFNEVLRGINEKLGATPASAENNILGYVDVLEDASQGIPVLSYNYNGGASYSDNDGAYGIDGHNLKYASVPVDRIIGLSENLGNLFTSSQLTLKPEWLSPFENQQGINNLFNIAKIDASKCIASGSITTSQLSSNVINELIGQVASKGDMFSSVPHDLTNDVIPNFQPHVGVGGFNFGVGVLSKDENGYNDHYKMNTALGVGLTQNVSQAANDGKYGNIILGKFNEPFLESGISYPFVVGAGHQKRIIFRIELSADGKTVKMTAGDVYGIYNTEINNVDVEISVNNAIQHLTLRDNINDEFTYGQPGDAVINYIIIKNITISGKHSRVSLKPYNNYDSNTTSIRNVNEFVYPGRTYHFEVFVTEDSALSNINALWIEDRTVLADSIDYPNLSVTEDYFPLISPYSIHAGKGIYMGTNTEKNMDKLHIEPNETVELEWHGGVGIAYGQVRINIPMRRAPIDYDRIVITSCEMFLCGPTNIGWLRLVDRKDLTNCKSKLTFSGGIGKVGGDSYMFSNACNVQLCTAENIKAGFGSAYAGKVVNNELIPTDENDTFGPHFGYIPETGCFYFNPIFDGYFVSDYWPDPNKPTKTEYRYGPALCYIKMKVKFIKD